MVALGIIAGAKNEEEGEEEGLEKEDKEEDDEKDDDEDKEESKEEVRVGTLDSLKMGGDIQERHLQRLKG